MTSQRLAMFVLSDQILIEILNGTVVIKDLPKDFKIHSVHYAPEYMGFLVKGHSDEFEEVQDGCMLPIINVQAYRDPEKLNDKLSDLTRRFCE